MTGLTSTGYERSVSGLMSKKMMWISWENVWHVKHWNARWSLGRMMFISQKWNWHILKPGCLCCFWVFLSLFFSLIIPLYFWKMRDVVLPDSLRGCFSIKTTAFKLVKQRKLCVYLLPCNKNMTKIFKCLILHSRPTLVSQSQRTTEWNDWYTEVFVFSITCTIFYII